MGAKLQQIDIRAKIRDSGLASGRVILLLAFSMVFGVIGFLAALPVLEGLESHVSEPYYMNILLHVTEISLMGIGIVIGLIALSKWDLYPYDELSVIHWYNGVTRKKIWWTGGTTAVLLGINFVLGLLLMALDIEMAENAIMGPGMDNPEYFLFMIPVMILLVGPIEELMFRGVIQGVLREMFSVKAGIAVASLLFGLIHIPAVGGVSLEALPYVVATGLLGLVLGYVYEETKSLLVPSLAHGFYNASLLLMQYYAVHQGVELVIIL